MPKPPSPSPSGSKSHTALVVGVAALALVAAAIIASIVIGGGSRSGGGTADRTVRLNIVTWPGYGPVYLAQEKGFFREEGIEVECQIQENTQARRAALVSGEIDLIGITFETVVLANMNGLPMQTVGVSDISNGGDGIIAKTSIQSIADLAGKRVAFPEGQPSHLFLLYHLDKAGIDIADITPVLTDDAGKAGELFAAGNVDAAVTWEPWLSTAVESGKGRVLVTSEGAEDILIGIFAGYRDRVPESSEKFQAFFRGWYRAVEYARANPDESNGIMADAFGIPEEEFAAIVSGLRWIDREEASDLLGIGDGIGRFASIADYNMTLWYNAGVATDRVEPAETFSPTAFPAN